MIMSELALNHAQSSRLRLLVMPREHGAWGILLIPLLSGGAAALSRHPDFSRFPALALAVVALFWLRTPMESLLGASPMRAQTAAERRLVIRAIALVGSVVVLGLLGLFWGRQNSSLLLLGAAVALIFAVQTLLRRSGRRARTAAQILGALGLTSAAAGAYYVVTGQLDGRALTLWLANWLFAANQVHLVQLRIHGAKLTKWAERISAGRRFLWGVVLSAALLLLAWHSWRLPGLALIAFVPLLVRGARWFFARPEPLRLHRLGLVELAHAIAFGALLSLAFAI